MSEHDNWRFRGAVYSAVQDHAKAFTELFEMLADEQRPLTLEDRLALIELIKHLTARGKRGGKPDKTFTRAWLVRQLAEEARRFHRGHQEARRLDSRQPRRSLQECGEQAVELWRVAEVTRLTARFEGPDLAVQLGKLEGLISDLTSSVLTELRGRGIARRRRGSVVK